jgi:uncharacterized repeat protein (TIGR01451 family)
MKGRTLLLAATAVLALSVAASTGAMSSVAVDRGVQVSVADDQNAYLGFQQSVSNASNGTASLNVTLTNQFPAGTTFDTVTVSVDSTQLSPVPGTQFPVGESLTVSFENVSCESQVSVRATGDGTSVALDRAVACG